MKNLLHFALTLLIYALFDLAWLNLFAQKFVHQQVGHFLAQKPDLAAAGIFYLIFGSGLLYFCVQPARSLRHSILNGAYFGLVTYSTYELVNKALLEGWPLPLVVVDICWGIVVGAVVSGLSFALKVRLMPHPANGF